MRSSSLAALAALAACGLCACLGPRPSAAPIEQELAHALALPGSVVYRTEGASESLAADRAELGAHDAVRLAIESSPELQAALARVRAAQAEAELAALLPNPILSLVFRFPEGGGRAGVEAGLGADLLALLQRPRRASAAGHRLAASAASALACALEVAAEAQELHARAQALEASAALRERRAQLLGRLRELALARVELGEAARTELGELDAQRLALELESARERRALRLARLALARRIGEPNSPAEWELGAWRAPRASALAEAQWVEAGLRARPELQGLEWELRARGDELALAGGAAYEGASFGLAAEREDGWSLGPALSAPLPLFGGREARVERAQAVVVEGRHALALARQRATEEIRAAYASFTSCARELEQLERELLPLNEERHAAAEEAWRLGELDLRALLLSEQALLESRELRIELQLELARARLQLERCAGGRAHMDSLESNSGELAP